MFQKVFYTVIIAISILPMAVSAELQVPQAIIEHLHLSLLESMKDAQQLDFRSRYQKLAPVLTASYDFAGMTRFVIGPAVFDTLTPTERKSLTNSYTRMSISIYVSRFNGYSGENFDILGEEVGPHESRLISTRLIRPDNPPIRLIYVMRQNSDGQWRIFDVFLEGKFSELSRQRSEYASVLQSGGIDALIFALDANSDQIEGRNMRK